MAAGRAVATWFQHSLTRPRDSRAYRQPGGRKSRADSVERNKWETAIRCLEVALHPNTSDDEVIAGVNGFRRTAEGAPLSAVCREFAGKSADETPVRENLELRRRLEREHEGQLDALRRLREAERVIRAMAEEISAEQRSFVDFRRASAQVVEGLKDENFDLRGALEQVRHEAARPVSVVTPFSKRFEAALNGERADMKPQTPSIAAIRHPWTA
jgi:hypothetical protein